MKTNEVQIGGQSFKLASLPLITLAELQESGVDISQIRMETPQGLRTFAKALGASLRRLHPEVSDEFVLQNLDAECGPALVEAFAKINGMTAEGEARDPNVAAG